MYKGVNKLTNNVASTLGPRGRNVILCKKGQRPVVTKDGVSFIGDAIGKEIGSAGAALDSASRAVSNLHLSILEPAFGRRPVQSSLTDW